MNTSRSAQTPTISINAGATITGTVAAIAHHPDSGVIVTIPGNPNGFIPNRLIAGKNNAAKAERRLLLIANPGMALEVFVEEAGMAAAKVDESQPAKTSKPRPRIILNEDKITLKKIFAARQEETARLRDQVAALNNESYNTFGDPEIQAKIQQYEMAFRMQTAVPEVTDLRNEPKDVIKMYGPDCLIPGTYAANCLLARKLSENGVRFVQLYHQGWDGHGNLPGEIRGQCKDTDQASAALITDLKQRGLLDETLVIWGGEFGRTNFCQGPLTREMYGRDHHPRCFSIWMAGGGIKPGVYGETDEFGYNITENPVHVNDFHATALHLLGLDHEKLTYKHLGRRYRLTDVAGKVVKGILA